MSCGVCALPGELRPQGWTARAVVALVRGYQLVISPLLPPACRFYPSCSQYMIESVQRHGVVRGGVGGLRRLCRCHPFNPGGYDPVR